MSKEFKQMAAVAFVLFVAFAVIEGANVFEAIGVVVVAAALYVGAAWVLAKLTERGPFKSVPEYGYDPNDPANAYRTEDEPRDDDSQV